MTRIEINKLKPSLFKQLKKQGVLVITHKGEDLCAVISMDMLNLLEGLQLENLEEEESADEIQSILQSLSHQ